MSKCTCIIWKRLRIALLVVGGCLNIKIQFFRYQSFYLSRLKTYRFLWLIFILSLIRCPELVSEFMDEISVTELLDERVIALKEDIFKFVIENKVKNEQSILLANHLKDIGHARLIETIERHANEKIHINQLQFFIKLTPAISKVYILEEVNINLKNNEIKNIKNIFDTSKTYY